MLVPHIHVSVDENSAMEIVIGHLAERGIASVAYMAGKEISFESAELFTMFHTQVRAHHLNTEAEGISSAIVACNAVSTAPCDCSPNHSCSRKP